MEKGKVMDRKELVDFWVFSCSLFVPSLVCEAKLPRESRIVYTQVIGFFFVLGSVQQASNRRAVQMDRFFVIK